MKEVWRPVREGGEVSDQGRVRSIDRWVTYSDGRRRFYPSQVLKQTAGGYKKLYRQVGFGGRTHYVHQLVLEAFVGPCPEGMEVCHGPGGPADNRLCNLSYGTKAENAQDRRRDGTFPLGEKNNNAKLNDKLVLDIRARAAAGETQQSIADRIGVNRALISYVVNRKVWAHV